MMESVASLSNENKQNVMEDGNKVPEANDEEFPESMNLFSPDDDDNDDDSDASKMLQAKSKEDDDSEGNDTADSRSVAVTANDLDKKKAGNNKVKAQYRWGSWFRFWKVKRRVGRKIRKYAGRLSYRLQGRGGKGGLPDYSDYGRQING